MARTHACRLEAMGWGWIRRSRIVRSIPEAGAEIVFTPAICHASLEHAINYVHSVI